MEIFKIYIFQTYTLPARLSNKELYFQKKKKKKKNIILPTLNTNFQASKQFSNNHQEKTKTLHIPHRIKLHPTTVPTRCPV